MKMHNIELIALATRKRREKKIASENIVAEDFSGKRGTASPAQLERQSIAHFFRNAFRSRRNEQ
jgi:hypothetical protein